MGCGDRVGSPLTADLTIRVYYALSFSICWYAAPIDRNTASASSLVISTTMDFSAPAAPAPATSIFSERTGWRISDILSLDNITCTTGDILTLEWQQHTFRCAHGAIFQRSAAPAQLQQARRLLTWTFQSKSLRCPGAIVLLASRIALARSSCRAANVLPTTAAYSAAVGHASHPTARSQPTPRGAEARGRAGVALWMARRRHLPTPAASALNCTCTATHRARQGQ